MHTMPSKNDVALVHDVRDFGVQEDAMQHKMARAAYTTNGVFCEGPESTSIGRRMSKGSVW
jgi:hypothetical protein